MVTFPLHLKAGNGNFSFLQVCTQVIIRIYELRERQVYYMQLGSIDFLLFLVDHIVRTMKFAIFVAIKQGLSLRVQRERTSTTCSLSRSHRQSICSSASARPTYVPKLFPKISKLFPSRSPVRPRPSASVRSFGYVLQDTCRVKERRDCSGSSSRWQTDDLPRARAVRTFFPSYELGLGALNPSAFKSPLRLQTKRRTRWPARSPTWPRRSSRPRTPMATPSPWIGGRSE